MVEIFAVELLIKSDFLNRKNELINRLPTFLLDKYNNFSHNDNLQRSILGELLARYYYSQKLNIESKQIIFNYGKKGKPYLPDSEIHFNISHSGRWVVAAFAKDKIGIDIELIREPNYGVANRFFSAKEIEQLNVITNPEIKKNLFFDFWTIKESYLKAIGTGLTKPLSTFTVEKNNNNIQLTDNEKNNLVFIKQYPFKENYKLSVCSFENEFNDNVTMVEF